MIKGDDYLWSHCTNAGDGAPYVKEGHVLRFPFPDATAITEIELAFNDPDSVGQFTELEFENAEPEGKNLK